MRVALLTVSDSVTQGLRKDLSGPAVKERCAALRQVTSMHVVPDEASVIQARLIKLADAEIVDVILTTGGTGIGPRDVTPGATTAVCERILPG